jgi:hypothetical protein
MSDATKPFRTDATNSEKLEALFNEQKLRNAQRRNDASTFHQFAQSQDALENQGRHSKPAIIQNSPATQFPRLPETSWPNQAAVVGPEESLGFDINETPVVGEAHEVAASIEALERAQQASATSPDADAQRGGGDSSDGPSLKASPPFPKADGEAE